MKTRCRVGVIVALTAVPTVFACVEREASAQTVAQGFAANRFEPSERGSEWFTTDTLDIRDAHLALGVVMDYARRPLVLRSDEGTRLASVVQDHFNAHLGASATVLDRLRLGFSVPITFYQDGNNGSDPAFPAVRYAAPSQEQTLGDMRLDADVRLVGQYGDAFTAAAGLQLFLPTGSRDNYTGDETFRVQPRVQVAGDLGPVVYAARAGVMLRPHDSSFGLVTLGSELTGGASLGFRVLDRNLVVGPEVSASTLFSNAFERSATPVEALIGAHYTSGDARFGLGGGTRLTSGYGAANVRLLASLEWVPTAATPKPRADEDGDGVPDDVDACPGVRGTRSGDPKRNGCPAPVAADGDGDGVADSEDACPGVAGDRTTDARTNGCPPDKDGDSVADALDACPDAAGPMTDDPKTRGCPPDKDGDGVLDADDACPAAAGVRSANPKLNGCPDPDTDKDGIANEQDACPDAAGKSDPDPKKNGCPMAFVQGGTIKILQQVKFKLGSADIQPGKDSESVLEAIREVLSAHPEIKRVRVEGHSDNVGAPAYNKKLSQQRAQSVVKWLVGHGIVADRLTAEGFGQERPIDDNKTEAGRKNNRRVDFQIESRESSSTETQK